MKRCRRNKSKSWDNCDDVIHNSDGSWSSKLRWSLKDAKDFLSRQSTFGLFEDKKGYYSEIGELICTAE